MRTRWLPEKALHLSADRQEKMVIAWARLRLIDKYETEFARQKLTVPLTDVVDERVRRISDLDRDDIAVMVERLTEKQKTAVKLLLFEGLTQKEAAQQMGCSQPAVCANYERARFAMREMLAPFAGVTG